MLYRTSLVAQQQRICLQCRRRGLIPWVGKIPWERKWQPTPVFLPGKSHGQRSLAGYSPWGHRVGHNLATKQQLLYSVVLVSLIQQCKSVIIIYIPSPPPPVSQSAKLGFLCYTAASHSFFFTGQFALKCLWVQRLGHDLATEQQVYICQCCFLNSSYGRASSESAKGPAPFVTVRKSHAHSGREFLVWKLLGLSEMIFDLRSAAGESGQGWKGPTFSFLWVSHACLPPSPPK